jgi:hypothetical protein
MYILREFTCSLCESIASNIRYVVIAPLSLYDKCAKCFSTKSCIYYLLGSVAIVGSLGLMQMIYSSRRKSNQVITNADIEENISTWSIYVSVTTTTTRYFIMNNIHTNILFYFDDNDVAYSFLNYVETFDSTQVKLMSENLHKLSGFKAEFIKLHNDKKILETYKFFSKSIY